MKTPSPTLRLTRISESDHACAIEAIRSRLRAALGGASCRDIAARTGFNAETVRRYLSHGHPSAEFLCAVSRAYGLSGSWLLTGQGPPRVRDDADQTLRVTSLPHLLRAVADKLGATRESEQHTEPKVLRRVPSAQNRDCAFVELAVRQNVNNSHST